MAPRADRWRHRRDEGPLRLRRRRPQAGPSLRAHRLRLPRGRVAPQAGRACGAPPAPGARQARGDRLMRRVDFYLTLTIDGMYADPEGGLDYFEPTEDEHRYANHLVRDAGDIVMGRVMYGIMDYWDDGRPRRPGDVRGRARVRDGSGARRRSTWSRAGSPRSGRTPRCSRATSSRPSAAMKAGDGPPIMVGCGADLFATLARPGLIDDVPVPRRDHSRWAGARPVRILREPLRMRLIASRTFPSGSVLLEYVPAT